MRIDVSNNNYQTPLYWAARSGRINNVRYLVKNGARIEIKTFPNDGTPLTRAAKNGHVEVVKFLIGKGANIEVNECCSKDRPPITLAASNGHFEVVKVLHKSGARVREIGGEPVLAAALYGNSDIVKYFVENGIGLDLKNDSNMQLIHRICQWVHSDDVEMIDYLMKIGANINATTSNGSTPIHYAILHNNIDALSLLLTRGGRILADKFGDTPLHYAATFNRLNGSPSEEKFAKYKKSIEVLLRFDADLNAKNESGHTPIEVARNYGHHKMHAYLKGLLP